MIPTDKKVVGELESKVEKFHDQSRRSRLKPKIFDFTYILTRNNLCVFKRFKKLVEEERRLKILDVGCGVKPWAHLFDESRLLYFGVDFEFTSSADVIASAEGLPFGDHVFDALIYSEVLEHVEDLDRALHEMRRVAKKDALIFVSTPFFFYEHLAPRDFRRLTQFAFRRYFQNEEILLLKSSNSILANPFLMVNIVFERTPLNRVPVLCHMIYLLNNLSALLMDLLSRSIVSFVTILYPEKAFVEKVVRNIYCFPLGYALLLRVSGAQQVADL